MTSDQWPARVAAALGIEPLTDDEVAVVLDLARDVAHGTERRFAPLTAYLAGLAVGSGASARLEEATAAITGLLEQ